MARLHPSAVGGTFAAALVIAFAGLGVLTNLGRSAVAAQSEGASIPLGPGLALPPMDPLRGKALFASKGCVLCHAVNGVGGTDAPNIDASTMEPTMNPFDLVAKMWNHSSGMIAMQQEEMGHQITFKNGQEIEDIVAFLHDAAVQKTFTKDDIPADIKEHMDEGGEMGTMMNNGGMGTMMNGGDQGNTSTGN
ncbi:MAG TPA: c-type cytochrome [Nitrospira sp.]|nr:c-type cytochrome [Nitrospira sp.]